MERNWATRISFNFYRGLWNAYCYSSHVKNLWLIDWSKPGVKEWLALRLRGVLRPLEVPWNMSSLQRIIGHKFEYWVIKYISCNWKCYLMCLICFLLLMCIICLCISVLFPSPLSIACYGSAATLPLNSESVWGRIRAVNMSVSNFMSSTKILPTKSTITQHEAGADEDGIGRCVSLPDLKQKFLRSTLFCPLLPDDDWVSHLRIMTFDIDMVH